MKKRFIVLILSFIAIYIFNFFIPRLMPGDPFEYSSSVSGEEMSGEMTKEQKEELRRYYGLDKPIVQQFMDRLHKNLKGDFGQSIHYKRGVSEILRERFPFTLYIMGGTLVISLMLGSFLALISLRKPKADKLIYLGLSLIGEIPPYIIGILLLFLIAAKVKWLPLSGAMTPFAVYTSWMQWALDILNHSFLPITALCLVTVPKFYFTARASFLTVIEKPYMLNGKGKGLKEGRILWTYIFINGIPPIIARFFLSVGGTIGGTLLIENVFSYPGLGIVMKEAVRFRDYILIQGVFLLSTVIVLLSMFLGDLINDSMGKRRGNHEES